MHPCQHVVSGHSAAGSLRAALRLHDGDGDGDGDGDIVNMKDDLSLGPLADVDAAESPQRAAFWRLLYGAQAHGFEEEFGGFDMDLSDTARLFRALPADPRPCLVWFGNGANEQLTLRRAAFVLADSRREMWAAEVLPEDQIPFPPSMLTGVGILRPDELAKLYERRRLLDAGERGALAEAWTRACAESSADSLRHYTQGRIETRPIDSFDCRILRAVPPDWVKTARVVGDAMAGCWDGREEDALMSDVFIFWRLRELAKRGMVEIDLPDAGMRDSKIRRVEASTLFRGAMP